MVHIVGQSGVKGFKQLDLEKLKTEKDGPSKFEQKRAQVENRQPENTTLSPEVTQVSAEQRRVLESILRKRLEQGNAQDPLKVDLRTARTKLDGIAKKVNAAPKTPAFDAVRNRLTSVEAQFQGTEKLMNGLTGSESPREMLQIQMQMYRMSQNVEILIKAAEKIVDVPKELQHMQV
jgi:hypothetical protein